MQTPSKLKNGQPIENGLGLRIAGYRGHDEVSHSGATAGYSTFLARFPNEHLSIAVLGNCNVLDAGVLVHRIVDAVLELPPKPAARPAGIELTPAELAAHAGMFHSVEHDLIVRTGVLDGKLVIGRAELFPIAAHTGEPRRRPTRGLRRRLLQPGTRRDDSGDRERRRAGRADSAGAGAAGRAHVYRWFLDRAARGTSRLRAGATEGSLAARRPTRSAAAAGSSSSVAEFAHAAGAVAGIGVAFGFGTPTSTLSCSCTAMKNSGVNSPAGTSNICFVRACS